MKEDDVVTAAALIRQESTRTEKCRGEEQLLVSTTEVCSERKGSELSTFYTKSTISVYSTESLG